MRLCVAMAVLFLVVGVFPGCSQAPDELGLGYSGAVHAGNVRLLVDETWTDGQGVRHVCQEIFDAVFEMVDQAEEFILVDFFLLNDFFYEPGPGLRPLSQELAERLVAKRKACPEVAIVFITDPINTVYGSIPSPLFEAMEQAGVRVVWTDLDALRDSNPVWSKPWRLLAKPWGTGPGNAVANPMGEGRISMRSLLKLLNFKANHRKVVATEKSLLVASANPHSASSAHWNVALRVDGAGSALALESESAILDFSGGKVGTAVPAVRGALGEHALPNNLELLTERRIKEKVLALLGGAEAGARIDLAMFYLADRDVLRALAAAQGRGCRIRAILDPNKDAFGRTRNGMPNRQSADFLARAGTPLRWADTHGEQFHAKMLYVEQPGGSATLLLGSCNFTRRNLDNLNAECDLAYAAPASEANMVRAREVFDRWWSNPGGRTYTTEYATYADPSRHRRLRAWLMERTGLCTF